VTGRRPIITIDGPAAAGKSTSSKRLAARLGFRLLDTGAMYRAVAWKAREAGLTDPTAIAALVRASTIRIEDGRAFCDGRDVSAEIRDPAVTAAVKPIADAPQIRAELVRLQREAGEGGGLVTEGRDQGSVVFPDAELKIYLDADPEVRARRRHAEQGGDLEEVRRAMQARDLADRTRPVGALVVPAGAVRVDSSRLTPEEVVAKILAALGSS
jgi:cytidylate kinase